MKQTGYLLGFAVLCVVVLVGSSALMPQDTIQKAPLPVVGNTGGPYTEDPQNVYLPLQAKRARSGAAYVGQATSMPAASGKVLAMSKAPMMHSYGGSASGGAGASMARGGASSSVSAGGGGVSVPQVAPRSTRMNRTAKSVVTPQDDSKRVMAAPQRQASGMVLSTATVSSDLALGYGAASAYIGSRSPMKAPPVKDEWGTWLDGWSAENNLGTDENGKTILDYNAAYQAWLEKNGGVDTPDQWQAFLNWFNNSDTNKNYVWAPIGDAVPFVLLLVLAYVLLIMKRNKNTNNIRL